MDKQKITDKEIADGILTEVKLTMQRIHDSHEEASKSHELKSDAFSRMKNEGLWDARKILDEYLAVQKKESLLPVSLRQMVVSIFEVASTNFWAKQVKKAKDEQDAKGIKKRGKK